MSDLTQEPGAVPYDNLPYDYQVEGGALRVDAPTYVTRPADQALLTALQAGRFCYVLNARQMGKSSLKVRTLEQLQAAGVVCAAVDLQGIGTSVTEEQWYFSILNRIVRGLGLRRQINLDGWWREQVLSSYVQRFTLFLETVLLPTVPQPIVIFIDEVDLTLTLPFSSDDFFGALRECYNRRANEPEWRRFTVALLGVATPADLIQNKQITPFNIGQPIDLAGFRLADAHPLLPGLATKSAQPERLLQAVLEWTGGQPFLTQKLCKLLVTAESEPSPGQEAVWVEQIVQTKIIENWEAQDTPQHLITIRDRLLHSDEQQKGRLLGLYQQIVQQGEIIADDSPEQITLRLTGLVVKRDNQLKVYNPIYAQVFSRDWLERELAKLRPYGEMIAAWLQSGQQDESRLLRGEALRDALDWSEGKRLGDEDYRFLGASQELETRDVQRRLAAEAEANQILTAAQQQAEAELTRANRRLRWSTVGAAMALALAALAIPTAIWAFSARTRAQQGVQQAQQQRDQLTTEMAQLDENLKAAEVKEESARRREQQAKQQARTAQDQYEQAQAQVQDAQARLGRVNQEKAQAEHVKQQAEQDKQAAEAQLQAAIVAVERAQATFRVAEAALKAAAVVTTLERAASNVLRQFDTDQTLALVTAMEAGQQLQALVQQKARTKDAVLVNQKLALAQYPTVSPIYSLQQVLSQIDAQEIPTHQGIVSSVSWSLDGQTLATGGDDGSVKLWRASGELITTLDAQQGIVNSISWSPDGQTLVTGSYDDDSVKLWRASGEAIQTIDAQQGRILSVSWSPDGQTLATGGSDDDSVKLWTAAGEPIKTLDAQQGGTNSMSWSPDGHLATVGSDGSITLWTAAGEAIQTIDAQQVIVLSVSWSPDGQTLATGGYDGSVKLWRASGEPIKTLDPQQGGVNSVSWSPDGQTLATGGYDDDSVKLWTAAGEPIKTLDPQQGGVNSVSWSPDGQTLATVGNDDSVKLWRANGETESLNAQQGSVLSVSWSRDGHLATGGEDGSVKLWRAAAEPIQSFYAQQSSVTSISWSPDGQTLATVGSDGSATLWTAAGEQINTLDPQQGWVFSVSWSRDGQTLATGGDGSARLWTAAGELIQTIDAQQDLVWSVSWSRDGYLATGGSDGNVNLWRASGELIQTIDAQQGSVLSVSWSRDGHLATGGEDGSIKLWTASGEPIQSFYAKQGSILSVSWSLDGQTLATGGEDGSVKLWTAAGEPINTLDTQQGSVTSVSWSPDGQTLATGGFDGSVMLWTTAGEVIQTLDTQQFSVFSVSWSPDGQTLATGGYDGNVTLLPYEDLDALLARGCRWLRPYLIGTPDTLQRLKVCQTPDLLRAAAPALVDQGKALAAEGRVDAAIQALQTAKRWDPSLTFDPATLARQIATDAP